MSLTILDIPSNLQIDRDKITEIVERLAKVYEPLRIYLFGSYAWGTPHQDSDYDICVIVEKIYEKPRQRCHKGRVALLDILRNQPIDLIVYTMKNFEAALDDKSTMASLIDRKGVLLYA
ncbi:MAG: nucleotidyltransferase domain-containing protein [Planctomycetaceae bacterium]|jgi:predicted nucleotidyltransferase|nr:nucleotidyltransferase domain-containing protein [Planctomycetaceae bacterium]